MHRSLGNIAAITTVGVLALGTAAYAGDGRASSPATTTGPAASTPARCDEGHWPLTVQFQPRSYEVGGRAGYAIWHNEDGWHLRTTTPSPEHHTFSGTIASTGNIKMVHDFHDEKNDSVKVVGNVILFRFDTHNAVDGFDFTVGCTQSVTFDLRGEGRQWPAKRIWLGARGTAPSDPFTVSRVG
jgi:hypothetical protein